MLRQSEASLPPCYNSSFFFSKWLAIMSNDQTILFDISGWKWKLIDVIDPEFLIDELSQ
jgi:hypothetical protein